jgi:outer membrane receptor protein involved in Fe transport
LLNNAAAVPFQTTNFNQINSATYFDLQETYHFNSNLALYLNIQNLFNLPPQFSPANSNYAQTTNEGLYDQIGRMFRLGVRFNY